MAILLTNAQNYDNVLLSQDGVHIRLAIHTLNGSLSTKLSAAQVQDLVTNCRQVLAELESNAEAQ